MKAQLVAERKTMLPEGLQGGGKEPHLCSQVFGDWPHSAAMEVWVGGTTSRQADVGWCWEFLQPPGVWGTCWDHPIVPDPAAQEMERKSTCKGGDFPTTTCSALSLPKENACMPQPVQTWVRFMLLCLLLVQCWTEGRWRMNSEREMWRFMKADNSCDPSIPHPLVLCAHLSIGKKNKPANHRKCKFIVDGVINLFALYFSFSNIFLILLILIPDLSCDWARSIHTFQSTDIGHIFFPLVFFLFLGHDTLCSAFASWMVSSCVWILWITVLGCPPSLASLLWPPGAACAPLGFVTLRFKHILQPKQSGLRYLQSFLNPTTWCLTQFWAKCDR